MPRLLDRRPRHLGILFLLAMAGVLVMGPLAPAFAGEPEDTGGHVHATTPVSHDGWSDDITDAASRIPVHHAGRVKPLLTYARFTLLRMNGYSVLRLNKGESDERIIGPTEWLLDVLFFPEVATKYACFRVQDWGALIDVGLKDHAEGKKKSDRYSFEALFPAVQEMVKKARAYEKIESKNRTGVQNEVILMARNVTEMYELLTYVGFARTQLEVDAPGLKQLLGGKDRVRISDLMTHSGALMERFKALTKDMTDPAALTGEAKAIRDLLSQAQGPISLSTALRIVPPSGQYAQEENWYAPAGLAQLEDIPADMAGVVADLERMQDARGNTGAFLTAVQGLQSRTEKLAEARGEFRTIPLEVMLFSWDPFFKALVCFLIGFLMVAVTWIRPKSKWLRVAVFAVLFAGLALTIYGITLRCLIREQPPVKNLYETVLFITGVAVLACLVTELINRQRIALAMAPVVGALGLFIAGRYEVLDAKDTMQPLVAVLRSNFWLSTHVTTIAIGYCAGLLAGLLGCVYVLGKAFAFKSKDTRFYTSLGRMTYGMVAFGLLFSIVGTILGGIWANDSWGRFWGWDPKENGALLIVLWCLVILHGRLGGYLGAFGIAMCSIFLGVIVAFSWWGVNLLGVGLHSYGFTQGVFSGLMTFYATQAAVLVVGFYWHFFVRGGAVSGSAA